MLATRSHVEGGATFSFGIDPYLAEECWPNFDTD